MILSMTFTNNSGYNQFVYYVYYNRGVEMFKIGDYVVHGRNGVCKIKDITHVDITGADKSQLYYILVPIHSENSKIFYPVGSNKVIMRIVISKKEAQQLISEIKNIEPVEIDNERQRENMYKETIGSCDCHRLIGMIKMLNERNRERVEQGKRATFLDDRYLKEAKKTLLDEFSIALSIDVEDVEEYIQSHI